MTHVFEGEFVHQNLGRIRKEFRVDQMCEWETRKAAVRGLFFCEHGIVIDTCEELDHLGEQAMQYLNITLREKDTQVIPAAPAIASAMPENLPLSFEKGELSLLSS